ncbi:mitochondrial carrier domain-containing protein [Tribonema minus]|uniref:Mitochondrial carrier domain-containing protein n=1 Tax=Tribonema minus TaxID=303371 RepID=A0A835Z4J2_9STRA|nr:mitochondrial carrier domain-containing protein [Tribonema minus]
MSTPQPQVPMAATFAVAGASGISAWMFIHPADLIKVRMQLLGNSGAKTTASMAFNEIRRTQGVKGLYAGLSAAITRQAVYTTARLGLYDIIKAAIAPPGTEVTVLHRLTTGLAAGGIAAFLTCPIEVCLVRMQADGRLPPAERRGYTNVFNALGRVAKEEGVLTYWRGASPTVARAMVVSATQLGTYDQVKTSLLPILGDGAATQTVAALTAAVVYSYASLPLDTAKTRMQGQARARDGAPLKYTGMLQTVGAIAREEGARSLWKGFTPYFVRSGGHTVLMFFFMEQYKALANRYYGVTK